MKALGEGRFTGRVARRVFVLFVLSAFLPLAAMALLSLSEVRATLLESGEKRLAASAKSYAMAVFERLLLAQDVAAAAVARTQAALPQDSLARRSFLSLGTVGDDGITAAVFGPLRPPLLDTAALERLAKGRLVVVVARSGEPPRVSLVMAAQASGGRRLIVGDLSPEYLWGPVDNFPAATDFCVFEDGTRLKLFCSTPDANSAARAIDTAPSQSSLRSVRWDRDGEYQRGIAWPQFMRATFGTPDWVVVASQPESFQLATAIEFQKLFIPVVVLALLLVTWFTIRQARDILVPVERLAKRARAIARKDFAARLNMNRNDEFGELAAAFDNMSARLGSQFAALTALSEIDQLILSAVETEQVVRTVIDRIGSVVRTDTVSVTLFDPDNPVLARTYSRAPEAGGQVSISRIDVTAAERNAMETHPQGEWVPLASSMRGHLAQPRDAGMQSAYVQPIVWREEVCGAVVLGYPTEAVLNDEEHKLVREFADRVAVAVSSAWRDEQLFLRAHYDALTDLPNRLLFKDRLDQMIVSCQRDQGRFAVLFIDLDHFKDVNDTFGHSLGDTVLQEAARRITMCVRASDTVSRLGGDEFTVLLSHIRRPQDAGRIAESIVQVLSHKYDLENRDSFLGASVGIALFPEDGTTADDLLKNADTAMYRAKAGGRSQAVFYEGRMNAEAATRLELDRELHHAIERGELVLHYQPQLDLRTGEIVAVEALIRWQHPTRGLVAPNRFIPLAEESGFIDQIGQWVIREACSQVRAWRADGFALKRVAVNVSPRQFRKRGLVEFIRNCVTETGIAAKWLEIEITEGLLVDQSTDVEGMLAEIHAMGIGVALDDFGTGFSSMAYLKRFPVDFIKIDRAFVEGLGKSADSEAIVAAVIGMSHTLGKNVTAEGVETDQQLAHLKALGCDQIQGYFLSPALPAAQLAEYVRSRELVAP